MPVTTGRILYVPLYAHSTETVSLFLPLCTPASSLAQAVVTAALALESLGLIFGVGQDGSYHTWCSNLG